MENTLKAQLEALVETLKGIPEAEQPGNAAYCLLAVAKVAAKGGAGQPLAIDVWQENDLLSRAVELGLPAPGRNDVRSLMAGLDKGLDSTTGINWDVVDSALGAFQFVGGRP